MDDSIEIGEPIIAWRIETYRSANTHEYSSVCIPITVDGDMVSNCIGVQNPDKTITVFEESTYKTISELNEYKYPTKKA